MEAKLSNASCLADPFDYLGQFQKKVNPGNSSFEDDDDDDYFQCFILPHHPVKKYEKRRQCDDELINITNKSSSFGGSRTGFSQCSGDGDCFFYCSCWNVRCVLWKMVEKILLPKPARSSSAIENKSSVPL